MHLTLHLTPDEVAFQTFATRFRGLDPDEVRVFLRSVADEVRRLTAERDMAAEAARRRAAEHEDLARERAEFAGERDLVLSTAIDAARIVERRADAEIRRRLERAQEQADEMIRLAENEVRERLELAKKQAAEVIQLADEQARAVHATLDRTLSSVRDLTDDLQATHQLLGSESNE